MKKEADILCVQLGQLEPITFKHVMFILQKDDASFDENSFNEQVRKQWSNMQKTTSRREMTEDRILLAENLRQKLENSVGSFSTNLRLNVLSPSEYHAYHGNEIQEFDETKTEKQKNMLLSIAKQHLFEKKILRLVVVSDTHGYETSLTNSGLEPWLFTADVQEQKNNNNSNIISDNYILPDGDILLHLGDFTIDERGIARKNALEKFDSWLSHQPHPIKIVVRGNHDPRSIFFPWSNAQYITKPTNLSLGNMTMTVIPYGYSGFSRPSKSRRSSSSTLLPSTCDILASHEPPYNILDKCISGKHAGSRRIRGAVEHMIGLPPKLWLCGHIHEGRGFERVQFGRNRDIHRETMIINAANANHGRANRLINGPTIIDISNDSNDSNDEFIINKGQNDS